MNSTSYPGAGAPPAGVIPNVDHPQDLLRSLNYVTQGLTLIFVSAFMGLRIYSKMTVLRGNFGWEDCKSRPFKNHLLVIVADRGHETDTTFISYIIMVGYCACGILCTRSRAPNIV